MTGELTDPEDAAWEWLYDYSRRACGEEPCDVSFSADQMIDAHIAGAADTRTIPAHPSSDDRQSVGVPASPSGYSAEPEPEGVSAVPVSIPNAAGLADSANDIRGAEMLEQKAKRTRNKSYKAALIATATYLRCRAGQVA